jgi:hypothetical protein
MGLVKHLAGRFIEVVKPAVALALLFGFAVLL